MEQLPTERAACLLRAEFKLSLDREIMSAATAAVPSSVRRIIVE